MTRIDGVLDSEEQAIKAEQQEMKTQDAEESQANQEMKSAANAIQSKPFYLLLLLRPPRYH
jgi:hypothetical protein